MPNLDLRQLAPALLIALQGAALAAPATAQPAGEAAAAPAPTLCPSGSVPGRAYGFYLVGNRAGFQTTCTAADGSLWVEHAFNDRGRGPSVRYQAWLDSGGLPTRVTVAGSDYLKGQVDEAFSREGERATWHNAVETGGAAALPPAFYLAQDGVPAELGLLARALLAARGGQLALWPQGRARIETLGEHSLGPAAAPRRLRLVAISGLGFDPVRLWLDAEGQLFALLDDVSALVPEGEEDLVPALREAQTAAEAQRRRQLAERFSRRPAGGLVLEHANLFDSTSGRLRPATSVVIEGDRIVAVGEDGQVVVPPGAERIDAAGCTLLPGLWDMHSHPRLDDGPLYLVAGVTGARDMAAEPEKAAKLAAFDRGEALGPRIALAGIIDGKGPYQGPTRMLVSTAAEARAAVAEYAQAGFPLIKIYSSVKPELMPVLIEEAHRRGMRVAGHIPAFVSTEQAIRAGFDEVTHINMVFLNFLFPQVQDTRTPARFTAVAEHAAELDLGSQPVRDFIALLLERGVRVDPTLSVFEDLFVDRPGQVARAFAAVADRLPPTVRRGLLAGGLPVPEGADERYRASFAALERMVLLLYRSGVPLVAGTDGMAGLALPHELELYVEAGLPAPEVLRMATQGAATAAGFGDRLGAVTPGKLADLILVDGDPTVRIGALRQLRLVIKDGAVIDPAALGRELGIVPP